MAAYERAPWLERSRRGQRHAAQAGRGGVLLGALVLRDHPLHRGQECALRTLPERMLETDQRRVPLLERLDQEPWMRIMPGQPSRAPLLPASLDSCSGRSDHPWGCMWCWSARC